MHIRELAETLGVSTRAIRFYEEQSLVRPRKHPGNGYRLYGPKDVRRLQTVISLREVGMTIEEIRGVLERWDEGDEDEVQHALELKRSVMFAQFVELLHNIKATDRMIERMKRGESAATETWFETAKELRALKALRANWRDHWNFDRQAEVHDDLTLHGRDSWNRHPSYLHTLRSIVDWVRPRKGERGLDAGVGTGNLAGLFVAEGIDMAGVDQSKMMLKRCNAKFPSVETKLGNFLAIPYLDHTFDFIVSSYALHHLTDEQKRLALDEMRRVAKPHGRICLADLMFEDEGHRTAYLDRLREQGQDERIGWIERHFFADRSALLDWFEREGYVVKTKAIHEILHLIYAVPARISY